MTNKGIGNNGVLAVYDGAYPPKYIMSLKIGYSSTTCDGIMVKCIDPGNMFVQAYFTYANSSNALCNFQSSPLFTGSILQALGPYMLEMSGNGASDGYDYDGNFVYNAGFNQSGPYGIFNHGDVINIAIDTLSSVMRVEVNGGGFLPETGISLSRGNLPCNPALSKVYFLATATQSSMSWSGLQDVSFENYTYLRGVKKWF